MNDKELANKLMLMGDPFPELASAILSNQMSPYTFVRDWRVAGALMDRCDATFIERLNGTTWACRADHEYGDRSREWYENESLPRAIIEACVEALE